MPILFCLWVRWDCAMSALRSRFRLGVSAALSRFYNFRYLPRKSYADRDGSAYYAREEALLNMEKQRKPLTACTDCSMPGYYFVLANVKCCRRIGTERCEGFIRVTIGAKDWAECPACLATGREGNKECSQCFLGSGWQLLRREPPLSLSMA